MNQSESHIVFGWIISALVLEKYCHEKNKRKLIWLKNMDFVSLFGREFIELIQRFNIDEQLLRQLMMELYDEQG